MCNKIRADLKNATGFNTSSFDWASLKSDVHKLDIDKWKNLPSNLSNLWTKVNKLDTDKLVHADLSKLSDVKGNDVVKENLYNAKIKNIEDKIPDTTDLATNTPLNAKINEIKNEISSINNLATTAALTTVENKILVI